MEITPYAAEHAFSRKIRHKLHEPGTTEAVRVKVSSSEFSFGN